MCNCGGGRRSSSAGGTNAQGQPVAYRVVQPSGAKVGNIFDEVKARKSAEACVGCRVEKYNTRTGQTVPG